MPTYIYRCNNGHIQEVQHSIALDPDVKCQVCDQPMNRQPQRTNVKFYGKGWGGDR